MVFIYLLAKQHFWIVLLCVILLGFSYHFYNIYTHLYKFPVPPFYPIIGHVLNYRQPEKVLSILTADLIKHGGIIRQYIGPIKPSLIIASREFLKVLCNNSRYISKSKFYDILKPWLGEGLITSDGHKWEVRRKLLTAKLMQTGVLKSFVKVFENKADILISVLDKYHEQEINIHPIMKRYTFDIIFETAMGLPMNQQINQKHDNYMNSIDKLSDIYARRMASLFKRIQWIYALTIDSVNERKALKIVDEMFSQIMEIKNSKKSQYGLDKVKENNSLLNFLMEIEIDGKKLERNDLREEVNSFIFAGHDTSSAAMALILYAIADNDDVQQKLFEEQQKLFTESTAMPVTYDIMMKMEYLDLVIKETLRIYPIVPIIGKRITKDIKYKDCIVPSMLNIMISIHGFHYNPHYFDEPEKFIPERFRNDIDPMTYIPFGVKPRQCIGKYFAMLEIKCAISKILRNFQILKVTTNHPLVMAPKVVLELKHGVWVKLKKRQ